MTLVTLTNLYQAFHERAYNPMTEMLLGYQPVVPHLVV